MLLEKIREDMKTAMKAKNKLELSTLRAIISAVQAEEVSGAQAKVLSDAEVEKVINSEVKKRVEAAEAFTEAGVTEKAETELTEKAILEKYLPKRLTQEEVEQIVTDTLSAGGWDSMGDMGKAMKAVNEKIAGRSDGRIVADLVKAKLA